MKIIKIVITGGPCAGKTSGLTFLKQELTKMGYKPVFINECATEIILSGLDPKSCKNNLEFERNIISLQIEKEKLYAEYCKTLNYDNIVLICDRGAMDCKSYMTENEFNQALTDLHLNQNSLMHNYDAVFHLVTAAKGAESAYTQSNNQARRENLEEAIDADTRTMNAWNGHPYFKLIDNSTDFVNKMKRLVNEICNFLNLSYNQIPNYC